MERRNIAFALIPAVALILIGILYFFFIDIFRSPETNRPKISVVLKTTERVVDFWTVLEQGLLQAAEDFDVELRITGPSNEGNIEEQIRIFMEELERNPDVVILAAADYNRLVEPVRAAREMGIPVLTVDSNISSNDAVSRIGTANFEAGGKLSDYLKEHLPADARIGVLSYVRESSTAIEREEGLRNGIDDFFNVHPTLYNNDDIEKAALDTLELMNSLQAPAAIVALNEVTARGLIRGIEMLEGSSDTLYLTFDSNLEIINGIERGTIAATVVQKPFNMGYQSVQAAVELVSGKTPPPQIDTGSVLITKENLFSPVIQKLLFPTVNTGAQE